MDVRIGITTSFSEGEQRLHHAYVRAVERAGGLPMIVPMFDSQQSVEAFVSLLDGLVMTGGPAVVDGLIGDLPEDIAQTDPVRLRSDRMVLHAFLESRKPVLGICYGMQFLNAAHGGKIYADVQRQRVQSLNHSEKRGGADHPLRITDDSSVLFRLFGHSLASVNTKHIQAIAEVAAPFRAVAAAPDDVVEAIENEDGTVIGVQFHPERMDEMLPLFRYLIENARKYNERVTVGT